MRHGGPIRNLGGVLQANAAAAARELRYAMSLSAQDEASLGKTGLAIRLSRDDEPVQYAHVLPLVGGELRTRLEPEAVAAVFIGAADDGAEGAEALAAAFSFTRAETRLVEHLLAGHSLKDSATALGVAMTTAKTHLENIFQKTGVRRQADLMRLAARCRLTPARLSKNCLGKDRSSRAIAAFRPTETPTATTCDDHFHRLRPLTFYVETFATTIRAISGLSRQTPSVRMTKSAGSKTWPLTKSSTARSTWGRSGSIKSKMNFDDPSMPSCIMPIVGS